MPKVGHLTQVETHYWLTKLSLENLKRDTVVKRWYVLRLKDQAVKATDNDKAGQRHVPENVRVEVKTKTQRAQVGAIANLLVNF